MGAVVIGRFSVMKNAAQAVNTLRKLCVSDERVRAILLNPPGPRAARSGGEVFRREGGIFPSAGRHATAHAAMLELVADDERRSPDRPAGVLIAVEAPDHVTRSLAINVFCQCGARAVEADAEPPRDHGGPESAPLALARLDRFVADDSVLPALCRPKPDARQH